MTTLELSILTAGLAGLCLGLLAAITPAAEARGPVPLPSFCELSGLSCPQDRLGR